MTREITIETIGETVRRPGVQVTFGLHVLLAILLCFVPLFDVLGFERAFATGLLAAITSPIVSVSLVRRAREAGGGDLARIAAYALLVNLLFLLPALFAGLLVEGLTQSCDTEEGFFFLLLCAGGSASFGTALGVLAGTLAYRRALPGIFVTLVLVGFLVGSLARLYAEPQIFVYSTPFGFWPGSIYDETLAVTTTLWADRAFTILLALALVGIARAFVDAQQLLLTTNRPRITAAIGALLLFLAAVYLYRSAERLGFRRDRASIMEALDRKVETEHFEIYFDPSIAQTDLVHIVQDHELRYAQLTRYFGRSPAKKVRSFVYRDASQKAQLMGAGRTQIARPWATEIHLNGFRFPHPVLKHELSHIFAGELASGPFKVPASGIFLINIGIVEGIAVAADWPARGLTVHGWTRAMKELNLLPDMRRTLSITGFWTISSARAYTVAGSFVRYLVSQHGMEKFAVLYAENDFQKAYGRSLDSLVTEWEAFLETVPLPEADLLMAEHRFKRPGIFQKVCAHAAANLSQRGYHRLSSGDLAGASEDLLTLLSYAPTDPSPLVDLSDAYAREGQLDRAKSFAERAQKTEGATQKSTARATEALAGIDWRSGHLASAKAGFESILTLHLSNDSDRLQLARLSVLERPTGEQTVLRRYLLGDLPPLSSLVKLGILAAQNPEDGLIRYLYGRRLEGAAVYQEALDEQTAAITLGLPHGSLLREARLARGRLLLLTGRYSAAEAALSALAEEVRIPAFQLVVRDWAERARFQQARSVE